MKVTVNLNESSMERLSFEMRRGGRMMMSHSMPVTTTMTCGSYTAVTYAINESDNASGMIHSIGVFGGP